MINEFTDKTIFCILYFSFVFNDIQSLTNIVANIFHFDVSLVCEEDLQNVSSARNIYVALSCEIEKKCTESSLFFML